jgi:nucleoside phosphorylase
MATLSEAKPFIVELSLIEDTSHPFKVFSGKGVLLLICGIGKANSAMATAYCCREFSPGVVINLGAAGSTVNSHSLGEICHISEVYEFDRPVFATGQPHHTRTDTLPGMKTAILATQDRAIISAEDRREVSSLATLVDMEGAAIAQTCARMGVRCLLFKFISDTPDHPEGEHIYANIKKYRMGLFHYFHRHIFPAIS